MTMEVTALGRLQPTRRKTTDRREMLQESVSSIWLIKALTDGQRGRLTSPRAKLTQSGRAHRHAGLLHLPMATLSGYSCKPGPLRMWLTIWVCPGLKVKHPDYLLCPWMTRTVSHLKPCNLRTRGRGAMKEQSRNWQTSTRPMTPPWFRKKCNMHVIKFLSEWTPIADSVTHGFQLHV